MKGGRRQGAKLHPPTPVKVPSKSPALSGLNIAFKTALILFASAVRKLKLLNYPTYTNERMTLLNKIKCINCSILESSDAPVTKILLFGGNSFSHSSNTLILNSTIGYIISTQRWLHFNSRIIIRKHYIAFLLAFVLFYF